MSIYHCLIVISNFLDVFEYFYYAMMLEIGGLGACPQKEFEIVSSETSKTLSCRLKCSCFIIRIHAEKEKLVLSNFEDLEGKKNMLQQILYSTFTWVYTIQFHSF